MKSIREQAADAEQHADLGPGSDERFSGYGVMGLPFSSGHVLAMRRFPVTSVGPGYTSVWLRRPSGAWSIYADAPPELLRAFAERLERFDLAVRQVRRMSDPPLVPCPRYTSPSPRPSSKPP